MENKKAKENLAEFEILVDKKKVKLKKSKEDWFWGTGRGYSQNVWRGSIFRVIAVLIIIVGLIIYLLIKKFYG